MKKKFELVSTHFWSRLPIKHKLDYIKYIQWIKRGNLIWLVVNSYLSGIFICKEINRRNDWAESRNAAKSGMLRSQSKSPPAWVNQPLSQQEEEGITTHRVTPQSTRQAMLPASLSLSDCTWKHSRTGLKFASDATSSSPRVPPPHGFVTTNLTSWCAKCMHYAVKNYIFCFIVFFFARQWNYEMRGEYMS